MKVIVRGSKEWDNYDEVVRNMTVLIYDWVRTNPEDKVLTILHTGSWGAESMVTQYIDKVKKLFKQKGYAIKDKAYRLKDYPGEYSFTERDRDMIENGGAEKVIVFAKDSCKRSLAFGRLAQAYEIDTKFVEE